MAAGANKSIEQLGLRRCWPIALIKEGEMKRGERIAPKPAKMEKDFL